MKKKALVLIIVFMMFAVIGFSQPPPPDAEPIPIDGGLFTLLIAGIFFGGREVYKHEKDKSK